MDLVLAKSAAWAWYERAGSGRPIREVDAWRTRPDPKPSRYKLEALRNVQADKRSLLDSYEIGRISNQLHQYIKVESSRVEVKQKKKPSWLRRGPICASRNDVQVLNQTK